MKHTCLAATAALTFALGGSALAQDGVRTSSVVAGVDLVLPANGSEGAVQTAASLPSGFSDGTVAYAQAQSVARYLAAREAEQARLAAAQRGSSPFRG